MWKTMALWLSRLLWKELKKLIWFAKNSNAIYKSASKKTKTSNLACKYYIFACFSCTVFRESCTPTKPQKGRGPWRARPQRERVSVIEPQNSCRKRALNTTAASNQRRPASASAWPLNDGHEGKGTCFPLIKMIYIKCTGYLLNILFMCSISDL